MPPLVEQTVQVLLSGVDQRTKDKAIRIPGRLVEATNVVQRKTGSYGKRYGFSALSTTTDSGTITTGRGLIATNGSPVLHADDAIYNRDAASSTWRNRGTQQRAFPSDVLGIARHANRPQAVVSGGVVYLFTIISTGYIYRVLDLATGVQLLGETTVTVTHQNDLCVAAAGGFVWAFYSVTGVGISSVKFNPASPSTAPVTTAFTAAAPGNPGVQDVMETANGVAVLWVSTTQMFASMLDTATGAASAAIGNVQLTTTVGTWTQGSWIQYPGTNGFLYCVGGRSGIEFRLYRMAATNFAGVASRAIGAALGSATDIVASGYSDDGDTVLIQLSDATVGSGGVENTKIHKRSHVWSTNTTVSTDNWVRQGYLASRPFKVGSSWYMHTGYDDANNLQRSYILRAATDGKEIARAMYGRAGNVFNRGGGGLTSFGQSNVTVSGTSAYVAVIGNEGVSAEYHTRFLTWDLAATFGPMRSVDGQRMAVLPGAWPARLGDTDGAISDLVPCMYPRTVTTTTAASVGATLNATYGVVIVYEVLDSRGVIYRSSPCPQVNQAVTTGNAIRITAPTLRTGNSKTSVQIRTYLTAAGATGSLFLNKITTNDPTVDTVTIDLTAASPTGAETLYTTGSELSNSPAPPFRVLFEWRNRVFLTDTDVDGEVWVSKEYTTGRGVEYAETLVFKIGEGAGRIRAAGVVDDNYAAFFKRDSISVIQGAGPDARGRGQYSPTAVPGAYGCTNPHSIATGPQGLYFQHTDGGIYLLDRTLNVVYIGRGVDDHKSATITAAVHVPKDQHVRFYTSTSKILVFDYGHPTETDPQGQWYVWTNAQVAGVAAANVNDVVHHVQSAGAVYKEVASQWFDGTDTPILPALELAPIAFSGILGYQQCMRVQPLGTWAGSHTGYFTLKGDYGNTSEVKAKGFGSGPWVVEIRPVTTRKCTALALRVEENEVSLTEGFTLEGVAFEILVEPRMRRLNTTARI